MSKRIKVLVSVVVAILLLAVAATATVMAEEEPTPPPEVGAKGLLARVAEILDIPEEDLSNAFNQARQEMRYEWRKQKPDALGRLFPRARIFPTICGRHMWGGYEGWHRAGRPGLVD